MKHYTLEYHFGKLRIVEGTLHEGLNGLRYISSRGFSYYVEPDESNLYSTREEAEKALMKEILMGKQYVQ